MYLFIYYFFVIVETVVVAMVTFSNIVIIIIIIIDIICIAIGSIFAPLCICLSIIFCNSSRTSSNRKGNF